MPVTTMVTTSQVIEIDEITDVSVTAIAMDPVLGDYYRDIVFFGTAPEAVEGVDVVSYGTVPTILRIRVRSTTAAPLHVSVPESEF
jgi:hypothetical protein